MAVLYFDSKAKLDAASPAVGDTCITHGYYTPGDMGGCTYKILAAIPKYNYSWGGAYTKQYDAKVDGITLTKLPNGTYAELTHNEERINIQCFGGKRVVGKFADNKFDNAFVQPIFDYFCDRWDRNYILYFPSGMYCFSPTCWQRELYPRAGTHLEGTSPNHANDGSSVIWPYKDNQKYLWKIGKDGELDHGGFKTCNDYIKNFQFSNNKSAAWTSATYVESYFCECALWITSTSYSYFEGLYFSYWDGSAMWIRRCCESYFGFMNMRMSGAVLNGKEYPLIVLQSDASCPSSISACYFKYFNVECSCSSLFYGEANNNFTHCEIGDIQAEAALTNGRVDGRFISVKGGEGTCVAVKKNASGALVWNGVQSDYYLEKFGITKEWMYANQDTIFKGCDNPDLPLALFKGNIGFDYITIQNIAVGSFGSAYLYVPQDASGNYLKNADGSWKINTARWQAFLVPTETPKWFKIRVSGMTLPACGDTGPWVMYAKLGTNQVISGDTLIQCPVDPYATPFRLFRWEFNAAAAPLDSTRIFFSQIPGIHAYAPVEGSQAPWKCACSVNGKNPTLSFVLQPNLSYAVRVWCPTATKFNQSAWLVQNAAGEWVSVSTQTFSAPAGWSMVPVPALALTKPSEVRLSTYGKIGYNSKDIRLDYIAIV